MLTFIAFLLRLLLLGAGLIFAASLLAGAVLGLALWGARAAWAPLGGRATRQPRSRTRRLDAMTSRSHPDDVTDVEVKLRQN